MTVTPWTQRVLLHDHLDGSATLVPILPRLFELSGKKYPFDPNGDIQGDMVRLFRDPQVDIVRKFSNTTGVMQNRETLRLVAQNYVRVRALQGLKYCEATVAPQYHTFGGLTEKQATEAFIEGIKEGEREFPNVEVNLLFSVGREVSSEEAVRLVNIAKECDPAYVVGIGLVCDEAAHPPEKHKAMFKQARKLKMKTTCHAGEWCHHPAKGPDWVRDQLRLLKSIEVAIFELGVDRLDHAIPLAYDCKLMKAVKERDISVTSCPANYLGGKLIPNTLYLKIRNLLAAGINYSLHPDDDLFMPNLNEVFQICNAEYHFTKKEIQQLLRNPWLARFGNRKEHVF